MLTREQVRELAELTYGDDYENTDDVSAPLFNVLVAVADTYLHELEQQASDSPAPYYTGLTPLQCLVEGLVENLEMIREPPIMPMKR